MSNIDQAHIWTEERLTRLEKKISEVYRQAYEERDKSVDAFFEWFEKADEKKRKQLEEEKITEKKYKQWRLDQLMTGNQYKAMRDKLAERMTHANEIAIAYINDSTPGIYSLNRNWAAYKIEQAAGNCDFTLFDERTVKRLITEEPDLMPNYPKEKALNRGIDLEYGKKQITASVTSGILQGKTIPSIARDLMLRISEMNKNSAIRSARTATTGAQNAGRLDGYNAAAEMGIKLRKQWLATLDGRTRHSHAQLDETIVERDKPFANGCMFPGDPNGRPEEIYNCRCTMIAVLDDEPYENAKRRARDPATEKNVVIADMTYSEWEEWKIKDKYKKQYSDYLSVLGEQIIGQYDDFVDTISNNKDLFKYWELDKKRQNYLNENQDKRLPGKTFIIPAPKFTEYLFNPENPDGYAKGTALINRLGYSLENWEELKHEIEGKINKYAALEKRIIKQGTTYEQKMVLYGNHNTPANVVVAWIHKNDDTTSMTSLYIKEIKE